MANISKNEYIALRKKGENYMTSPVHDEMLQKRLKEAENNLMPFLSQPLEDIQEWQLKRLSYLVDYAFNNIPLYRKNILRWDMFQEA